MVRNSSPNDDFIHPDRAISQAQLGTLQKAVDAQLANNPLAVQFDLSRVESIDSAALNWFLEVQGNLQRQGVELILRDPSPICSDILLATRLDQRFKTITSSPADATPGAARHA